MHWQSPDVVSQTSINEVIKYTASRWLEVLVAAEPTRTRMLKDSRPMRLETLIWDFRRSFIMAKARILRSR